MRHDFMKMKCFIFLFSIPFLFTIKRVSRQKDYFKELSKYVVFALFPVK